MAAAREIKWASVCKPKEVGGLSIPDLGQVNNGYLMKFFFVEHL